MRSLLACTDTLIDLVLNPGWNGDEERLEQRQDAIARLRELIESEQFILYIPPNVLGTVHLILRTAELDSREVYHVFQKIRGIDKSNFRADHERILGQSSHLIFDRDNIELYEVALLTYAYELRADVILVRHPSQLQKLVELKREEFPDFHTRILRAETFISYVFEHQFLQDIPDGQLIRVFTPNGTRKYLPYGSTSIDFAYKIHTDVGDQCIGAKVNGVPVPLGTTLNNCDTVEILRGTKAKPQQEWLKFAHTRYAREKIQRGLKRYWSQRGWKVVKRVFGGNIRAYKQKLEQIASEQNRTLNGLMAKVGSRDISLQHLCELMDNCNVRHVGEDLLCVNPQDWVLEGRASHNWRLSSCCNPLPGDKIVGAIGKQGGMIRVHCSNCQNLEGVKPERQCELSWNFSHCSVQLLIRVRDRPDTCRPILDKLVEILADSPSKPDLRDAYSCKDGTARSVIKIPVASRQQLNEIVHQIQQMPRVLNVKVTRLMPIETPR